MKSWYQWLGALCVLLILGGCAPTPGGEDETETGGGSGSGSGGSSGNSDPTVSYRSLTFREDNSSFSGDNTPFVQGNRIQNFLLAPAFMIEPINSGTLEPELQATVDDYVVYEGLDENGERLEIDPVEQFPVFRKVISMPKNLKTALVIDISGSASAGSDTSFEDFSALKTEIKAFIAAAKASSNETIQQQQFTIWVFNQQVIELTEGFETDQARLNLLIDSIDEDLLTGMTSLNQAIVQSIGRYVDSDNNFLFTGNEEGRTGGDPNDNDLYDESSIDGLTLSNLVLFSAGPNTVAISPFTQDLAVQALESQVLQEPTLEDEERRFIKPLFLITPQSMESMYSEQNYLYLTDRAERIFPIDLNEGAYGFANELVSAQISALDRRFGNDNIYIYQFETGLRGGSQDSIFEASNNEGYGYYETLTIPWQDLELENLPHTFEIMSNGLYDGEFDFTPVEITGPNGEYIANKTVKLAEYDTFAAKTFWTNDPNDIGTYTWSGVAGTASSDGLSFTATGTGQLTLVNSALGGNESYTITIE